jgi:hypothetical protein
MRGSRLHVCGEEYQAGCQLMYGSSGGMQPRGLHCQQRRSGIAAGGGTSLLWLPQAHA